MSAHIEADRQIRATLATYCETIDRADFDGFAALFARGRWFMVDAPGVEPVRTWLNKNVVLYDGNTHTRHEITNVRVDVDPGGATAEFRCYLSIWQHRPGRKSQLLAQVRFTGTFLVDGGEWWWSSHTMIPDFVGDLSGHIKSS